MASRELKNSAFKQGIYDTSTVQLERLGTLRILNDGRKFRYSKSGAAITVGKAIEGSTMAHADYTAQTLPTIAVGDYAFIYAPANNKTEPENAFADGYFQVSAGTGAGQSYQIESSLAEAAGKVIPIVLKDPVVTATATADSKGTILKNEYCYTITAATITNPIIGIQVIPAGAANVYTWVQTGGVAVALIAGTPAIGNCLIASVTDGALAAGAMAATSPNVGHPSAVAGADGKYYPVTLYID